MKKYINQVNRTDILAVILLTVSTIVLGLYTTSEYLIDYSEVVTQGINLYRFILQIGLIISIAVFAISMSNSIEKIFLKKLKISYFIYLLVSYLLLFTQNLNNEDFYIFGFLQNKFLEIRSLPLVVIVIGLAYCARVLSSKNSVINNVKSMFNRDYLVELDLAFLLSLVVLHDSKLLENLKQFLNFADYGTFREFFLALLYKLLIIIITVSVLTCSFWQAIKVAKQNKSSSSLAIVSSIFFALVFNFTIQFGIRADEAYADLFIFPGATLFQIIILSLLFLLIYFLCNRYWLSTIIILFSGIAFSIANGIKFMLRNEPLLLTDFSMVAQLNQILSFLDSKIILLSLSLITTLLALYVILKKRFLKGSIFSSIRQRIVLTLAVISLIGGIFTIFIRQENGYIVDGIPVLSRLNNGRNITFEGHARSARYQSLMFVWMKQLTRTVIEKPENYNQETIAKLVDKYQKRAEEINATRTQNISDETVIFILSEGLANPNRVEGVTLTKDILKNIDEIKSNTTSGLMKSDNYGGGTANMETQALVGLPFYNLSPSISIYNVEVLPKMSIVPSISDQFLPQNRLAIHLAGTQLYSRADVYNRLRFGTFVATDGGTTKPTVNEKYGGFPSDASTYQNILNHLDLEQNQFFSVITYQNHIPWTMEEPADIIGTGVDFSDLENDRLTNYSRLVYETDIVTKEFLDTLSAMDKKITVVFYGDHLPGLYPQSAFEHNPESQYLTDYFIWSNKDNKKLDFPLVNSTDFPAAVLAHTNSKVSPYYALLTDVLENASVDKKALTDEQQLIANDLKLIEYDLISGKSYLKKYKQFFTTN